MQDMSPFNPYTTTPPKIVRAETVVGYLTVNEFVLDKIDTNQFVAWLNTN
jgi:hypothetical protein